MFILRRKRGVASSRGILRTTFLLQRVEHARKTLKTIE